MQKNNGNKSDSAAAVKHKKKVLIFVVCYNAEKSIESVLDRIPKDIWESNNSYIETLIIDNQSSDQTFFTADDYARRHPERNLTILYNPKSQGYGANQKIGYCYAIKNGFDAVVLLHGDGKYAPEYVGQMLEPILDCQADAVLGSRMIHRFDALKGQMPLYKWIGNQVLTFIQNRIIKSHLSEFHSGYRAYSVEALASIPFSYNSDNYDFDTDIIIQLLDTQKHVKEIEVPTFYDNQVSGFNGIKYAVRVIRSSILSRAIRLGIYYHPKFDYEPSSNYIYQEKFGYPSSHQFALDQVKPQTTVVDIGCGPGFMASRLNLKNVKTVSIDIQIQPETEKNSWKYIEADVEKYDFDDDFGKVDYILALDILEHLKSPERLLKILRQHYSQDVPTMIITTGNVSFLPVRIGLLFDNFNYGRRGVLDMDHTRLFTFSSLQRILEINGYEVIKKKGVPAPFPLALGDGWLARFLLMVNRILISLSKHLFSYQVAVIARPIPTLEHLLEDAHAAKNKKLASTEQT